MIRVRSLSRAPGAQAFAIAIVVAVLMAFVAIGGYELGISRAQSHSLVVQPSAVQPAASPAPEAPPITGFQP